MNAASWSLRKSILVLLAAGTLPAAMARTNDYEAKAGRILDAAGVRGGLVVHVGCADGKLTAALGMGDGYLVQGLDRNAQNVEHAREQIDPLARAACGQDLAMSRGQTDSLEAGLSG